MADPAKVLFRNASYDGQLMRTLAAAMAGSADVTPARSKHPPRAASASSRMRSY